MIDTLAALVAVHGAPAYVRSDNGGECIAARVTDWLARQGSATVHIEPGHPWENGFIESFNGKLRDECLNEEVSWHERHARVVIEACRRFRWGTGPRRKRRQRWWPRPPALPGTKW